MKSDSQDELRKHAIEIGCDGLLDGYAIQTATGSMHYAELTGKGNGPFHCPECFSEVIHRRCTEVCDHFAHHARTSSILKEGESELHLKCKTVIFTELQRQFPQYNWVCDNVIIKPNPKKKLCALKPDIGGRIKDQRVAIEIQASSLTLPRLLKRSLSYAARGVSILWIVPLNEPLGEEVFRPRLFERFLHSIYFGRTYYWYDGLGSKVQPVHYSPAYFHVPFREWHDENGDEMQAGDYFVPYKRLRKPLAQPPIEISQMFEHRDRPEHRPWNERKTVPAMRILQDKLPIWWNQREDEMLKRTHPEPTEEPE